MSSGKCRKKGCAGPTALRPHPPPRRCPPYPALVVGREASPAASSKPRRVPGTLLGRPGAGTLNPRDFSAAAAGSMNWRTALCGHFQFRTERGGARAKPVSSLLRQGRGGRLRVRICALREEGVPEARWIDKWTEGLVGTGGLAKCSQTLCIVWGPQNVANWGVTQFGEKCYICL